jgi:hypothetical protein
MLSGRLAFQKFLSTPSFGGPLAKGVPLGYLLRHDKDNAIVRHLAIFCPLPPKGVWSWLM